MVYLPNRDVQTQRISSRSFSSWRSLVAFPLVSFSASQERKKENCDVVEMGFWVCFVLQSRKFYESGTFFVSARELLIENEENLISYCIH